MRAIWSIARLSLRVLFRQGAGPWLLICTALVTLATYAVCRSDGLLEHELPLRIRYALTFGLTVFSLALLWLACLSLRGDIDARRMHLLTSYPLRRRHIFLGKWLALFIFSAAGMLTCWLAVGLAVGVQVGRWETPAQVGPALARLWRVERECRPVIPALAASVESRLKALRDEGGIPAGMPEAAVRAELTRRALQQTQVIEPLSVRTWDFDLGTFKRRGGQLIVRYRFYARDPLVRMSGAWQVKAPGYPEQYLLDMLDLPDGERTTNASHDLVVPLAVVPPDGKFQINFRNDDNKLQLLSYRNSGMRVYYTSGNLLNNLGLSALLLLAHFAVIIALGLALSTAFTMSIAIFASTVLYMVAVAVPFFQRFISDEVDLYQAAGHSIDLFISGFIRFGLFFTTGLEPPEVVQPLSDGTAITATNVGMDFTREVGGWLLSPVHVFSPDGFTALQASGGTLFAGYLLYFLLVLVLGSWWLTRKELDRVH